MRQLLEMAAQTSVNTGIINEHVSTGGRKFCGVLTTDKTLQANMTAGEVSLSQ